MPHPEIDNRTPFIAEALPQLGTSMRPVYTVVLKASYEIAGTQQLTLAEEQSPLLLAGEYYGDPAASSLRFEPECSLYKQRTDVALIGHAFNDTPQNGQCKVGIKVGELRKTAMVFGNRVWKRAMVPVASAPEPFETLPLCFENAFGGQDLRIEDEQMPAFDSRNPVGKGYAEKSLGLPDDLPLPNIEDPEHLIQDWTDRPTPWGFGFVAPHWQPRQQLAGTYDQHWEEKRKPRLPEDFNPLFFNAASSGLQQTGYLQGDEEVVVVNASERGRLAFKLPGLPAPVFQMKFHRSDDVVSRTNLDTVIVDTDQHKVFLLWRAMVSVPRGHLDLAELNIKIPGVDILTPGKKAG